MPKKVWSPEETALALALYLKIPFGHIHKNNIQIIKLAELIDRTPSAVSMKMCNFARFDKNLSSRGVSGLSHGSKTDLLIWNQFYENTEALLDYIMKSKYLANVPSKIQLPVGDEQIVESKVRINQNFFRQAVLASYNETCCITGLNIPDLLCAAHIKPWCKSNPLTERTNPSNGICLNYLHHEAFDRGIITIDEDYKILISKEAKNHYTNQSFKDYFLFYEGKRIFLPNRFYPSKEMIQYHNSHIFLG